MAIIISKIKYGLLFAGIIAFGILAGIFSNISFSCGLVYTALMLVGICYALVVDEGYIVVICLVAFLLRGVFVNLSNSLTTSSHPNAAILALVFLATLGLIWKKLP